MDSLLKRPGAKRSRTLDNDASSGAHQQQDSEDSLRERLAWENVIGPEALKLWYLDVSENPLDSFMEMTIRPLMGELQEDGTLKKTGRSTMFMWEVLKMTWAELGGSGNPNNTTSSSFGATFRPGASARMLAQVPDIQERQRAFFEALAATTDRIRELLMEVPALLKRFDPLKKNGYERRNAVVSDLYEEYRNYAKAQGVKKNQLIEKKEFETLVTLNDWHAAKKLPQEEVDRQLQQHKFLSEFRDRYHQRYRAELFALIPGPVPNQYSAQMADPEEVERKKKQHSEERDRKRWEKFTENENDAVMWPRYQEEPFITRYRNAWKSKSANDPVKFDLTEVDPNGYRGVRLTDQYRQWLLSRYCQALTPDEERMLVDKALHLADAGALKGRPDPQRYNRPRVTWQGRPLPRELLPPNLSAQPITRNSAVADMSMFYVSAPRGKTLKIRLDLGAQLDVYEVGHEEVTRPSYGSERGVGSMEEMAAAFQVGTQAPPQKRDRSPEPGGADDPYGSVSDAALVALQERMEENS